MIRLKGAPATPKYLMATHVGALLQAAILLGLVWAARLSTLGLGWLDAAAWLGSDRRRAHVGALLQGGVCESEQVPG